MSANLTGLKRMYFDLVSGPLRSLKEAVILVTALVLALASLVTLVQSPAHLSQTAIVLIVGGWSLLVLVLVLILVTKNSAKLNDVLAHLQLQDNLHAYRVDVRDFFVGNAAANSSFHLFIVKCLTLVRPKAVLELGSGQTTKLIGAFAAKAPDMKVATVEHDAGWVDVLSPYLHDTVEYRHSPLAWTELDLTREGLGRVRTEWYSGVEDLMTRKYELIIVDGPNGVPELSRSGILAHLPAVLSERWILVFDDAERAGEIGTVAAAEKRLQVAGTRYVRFEINGTKRQIVLSSPSLSFLQYT